MSNAAGTAFLWFVGMLPAGMINCAIADTYGWPSALTMIARIVLWPLFLFKLIVLVLIAGVKDLWP